MVTSISVVIPTYNRAAYLPATVESVMAQSVQVHEILIVDDGSTDETERIVHSFAGPIRYFQQRNRGPAAARNLGIREATGELIALVDSDDLWEPDKLARQLVLLDDPEVGLVHTAARIIDGRGRETGAVWGKPAYQGHVFDRLLVANGINASSVLTRRSLLLEVGAYDERFPCLENWELWVRLSRCCAFAYVDSPLIRYRVHGGNLIRDLQKQRRAYGLLLEKHLEHAPAPPLAVRRQAYARFHRAFADALVGQGHYSDARRDFLRSLFFEPWQPEVWWRLFRISTARPPQGTLG